MSGGVGDRVRIDSGLCSSKGMGHSLGARFPPVIALLTPYSGRNLGDGAIQTAFIERLRALCPQVEIIGLTENAARTAEIHGIRCESLHAGWAAAWKLLERIDLLVVAGGGQLDEEWGGPWSHPFVLYKWTALARLRGVPVAIASVGMGVVGTKLAKHFVRAAVERSAYRSFRDTGTRELLAPFVNVSTASIVPDVALSLPLPAELGPPAAELSTVGVVPIVYGHSVHWPTVNVPIYERYVRELARSVEQLLAQGRTVRLFTSNSVDRVALDDVMSHLDASVRDCDRLQIAETGSLEALLNALRSCHVVIASRLHAVILAHRLACPVVALAFDRKVNAQMEQAGQGAFCLDIHTFDKASLLAAFAALDARAALVRGDLATYVERSEADLARQFEALLALATPHAK